jgi:hypothetical protein
LDLQIAHVITKRIGSVVLNTKVKRVTKSRVAGAVACVGRWGRQGSQIGLSRMMETGSQLIHQTV